MEKQSKSFSRKQNRLTGFDYSQPGSYFITIVTQDKACILGSAAIEKNTVELSAIGHIVQNELTNLCSQIEIPYAVIMPNHLHFILTLRMRKKECAPQSVPEIVRCFKRSINFQIGQNIWRRSFHDRIIRNQEEFNQIAEYILSNPEKWAKDTNYQKS